MKTYSILMFGIILFIFAGCTNEESTPIVVLDDDFAGFWFKQDQHHKAIVSTQGYLWGFRIEKSGALTMARLTASTGQMAIEENGAMFTISSAADGVFKGSNTEENITGTYRIDTTVLSGKYHPRMFLYSSSLVDQFLPGGTAGDWSVNGFYVKVLNHDDTEAILPSPDHLPASLSAGLVAYFPFNGNAHDESGNGHHGTVSGAVLSPDRYGNQNRAYRFDRAAKNMITVPHSPVFSLTTISISAWINPSLTTSDSDGARFVDKGLWGDPECTNYSMSLSSSEKIRVLYEYGSGTNVSLSSNYTVPLNSWIHAVYVFNSVEQKMYIYVNGTINNLREDSPNPVLNTDNLIFGGAVGSIVNTSNFFNGQIDDIRIYNRILTEMEIMALCAVEE